MNGGEDKGRQLTQVLDAYARRRRLSHALYLIGIVLIVLGISFAISTVETGMGLGWPAPRYGDLLFLLLTSFEGSNAIRGMYVALSFGLIILGAMSVFVGYRVRPRSDKRS